MKRIVGLVVLISVVLLPIHAFASVLSRTNKERSDYGISKLVLNKTLSTVAKERAIFLAKNGSFEHTITNGEYDFAVRIKNKGFTYCIAGENLSVGFNEKNAMKAWMDSPPHKKNILDERFDVIGVGQANGMFNGKSSKYIVQIFADTCK